ncbi:hypothetical protein PQR46_07385 [Paraburkholderia sediminicola]|uniref:hypothetical protein n=1 Tax=Paraburkholderia sediminicola TaxID=458836 RepID=UPI0038BCB703
MTAPKTLALTLPTEAMEIVLTALAELPYRVAQPVMQSAQQQFAEQLNPQRPEQPANPA